MNSIETNPFQISRKSGKPLILDGATGSLLQQQGYSLDNKIWGTIINESCPDVVQSIHKEYINAGVDIITTNTFRTNPAAFIGARYHFESEYVINAVKIANKAIGNSQVLLAGSNPPAEDCYKKSRSLDNVILERNHINHIDLLIDNGVNFILNETQSHLDEIEIICKHCSTNNIPFVLSLYVDEELRILSGEKLLQVINFISNYAPLAIAFNCIVPSILNKFIDQIPADLCWGYYLNCGRGNTSDRSIECGIRPEDYANIVAGNMSYKPSFVGACCGSNPEHIKAIKKLYG